MIPWIAAAFLVVGFVAAVRLLGLVEASREVRSLARHSLGVLRSADFDDEEKELALQGNAKQLFRLFLILAFGGAAAALVPLGPLWLFDQYALISLESVFDVALSPAFTITGSALAILALSVRTRTTVENDANSYSRLDRVLHRVAFKTYSAQVALADIEDRVFAKRLAPFSVDRPVFITSLPRAGTTLLLESCARVPEFASHCYRDMPFTLIPCLWSRFSTVFRQAGQSRERAHGDGMLINLDSPEALEEVLWKTFWRRHYRSDRIIPWQDEDNDEFDQFLRSHMRKIILLRRGNDARYLSKNNLNIARTRLLRRLFPNSVIVVPFRRPLHHAASLLQQHRNFLGIHERDPFTAEYMREIGHFDFGENLRPVDFGGWLDSRQSKAPTSLGFWLEYWVAAYEYLLAENGDSLAFVSYEALCEEPRRELQLMAETIGSRDPDALLSSAIRIHPTRTRQVDTADVSASVLRDVNRVYAKLTDAALSKRR